MSKKIQSYQVTESRPSISKPPNQRDGPVTQSQNTSRNEFLPTTNLVFTDNLENQAVNNLLDIDNGYNSPAPAKQEDYNDFGSWSQQQQIKPIFVYQSCAQPNFPAYKGDKKMLQLYKLQKSAQNKLRADKFSYLGFAPGRNHHQLPFSNNTSRISQSEERSQSYKSCMNIHQILP